jgi:Tfp pilus assembly protein PilN
MIQINLVPGARRAKKAGRAMAFDLRGDLASLSGRIKDPILIGAVAGALLGLGGIGWMYYSQDNEAKEIEAAAESARRDSVHHATLFADKVRAEAAYDSVLRQVNLIAALDEDRYVWPHILDEVSRALPAYTWLTSLVQVGTPQGQRNHAAAVAVTKDADSGKVTRPKRMETEIPPDPVSVQITVRTVDIQAMPRFMTQLEASPYFGDVLLNKSDLVTVEGQEVTEFELTLIYARPDSSQVRREPMFVRIR